MPNATWFEAQQCAPRVFQQSTLQRGEFKLHTFEMIAHLCRADEHGIGRHDRTPSLSRSHQNDCLARPHWKALSHSDTVADCCYLADSLWLLCLIFLIFPLLSLLDSGCQISFVDPLPKWYKCPRHFVFPPRKIYVDNLWNSNQLKCSEATASIKRQRRRLVFTKPSPTTKRLGSCCSTCLWTYSLKSRRLGNWICGRV